MKVIKSLHKWVALLVAIQMCIWIGTGIYFNLMDQQATRGNQYRADSPNQTKNLEPLIALSDLSQFTRPVHSVDFIAILGTPFYEVKYQQPAHNYFAQNSVLVNAISGEVSEQIDANTAQHIATLSYSGPGEVNGVNLLTPPISDLPKERNAVWQVQFTDDVNTTVYIAAHNGKLIKHVNDLSRLKDFMMMLHFMDYFNEGSFNTIQLQLFSLIALTLSLTGVFWLIQLWRAGKFKIALSISPQTVHISRKGESEEQLTLPGHLNYFEALAKNNREINSECGGGGTCGRCLIKLPPSTSITDAEREQISEKLLAKGLRLACQHLVKESQSIEIIASYKN